MLWRGDLRNCTLYIANQDLLEFELIEFSYREEMRDSVDGRIAVGTEHYFEIELMKMQSIGDFVS